MISDAWKVLDGYVEHIDEDGMKERARGGAEVLSTILAVEPSTISKECGRRAALRRQGQVPAQMSSAELRGKYEPLRGSGVTLVAGLPTNGDAA